MAQSNKVIQVVCWVVVAPTHKKAFLAEFRDADGDKIGDTWLPYSRVKQVLGGEGGFTVEGEERDAEITIDLPQWLAESDRVEPLIREQVLAIDGAEPEEDGRPDLLDGTDDFYGGDDDPGWGG